MIATRKTLAAPDHYKELSPIGTSPFITDDDIVLAESNAIIDYVLDRYGEGRLRPDKNGGDHARYLFWFHASQGSVQPLITMKIVFAVIQKKLPFFLKPLMAKVFGMINNLMVDPRLERILQKMERDLEKSEWLAGDELTAADISMCYCMETLTEYGDMDSRYPNCQAYLQRMRCHPAYLRALQRDGKYNGAPPL